MSLPYPFIVVCLGFNGAAAEEPRIPSHFLERSSASHGFNGAAAEEPRIHRNSFHRRSQRFGFNGAAAEEPRILHSKGRMDGRVTASMGPRLRSRGYRVLTVTCS